MQSQGAGLRIINQARGIARAHLEQDAHFEFAECFPPEETVHIVICVARGDDVKAQAAALGDKVVQLCGGTGRRVVTAGETEIILLAQLAEFMQSVDEQIRRRRVPCVFIGAAAFLFGRQAVHDLGKVAAGGDSHFVRNRLDDPIKVLALRRTGRAAVQHDEFRGSRERVPPRRLPYDISRSESHWPANSTR